jgi:hypothetical protein
VLEQFAWNKNGT